MKVFSEKKINPFSIVTGIALVGMVLITVSILLFSNEETDPGYIKQIQQFRQEKDLEFKTGEESPIENKEKFDGLAYFFPNINYRVEARLNLVKDSIPITILRSDGKQDNYVKYAEATFELERKEHRVILLKKAQQDVDYLFLPFSDQTAGRETYAGGRYLDLKIPEEDKIIIDFNLAYNPYCVYNYRYSCPLPPKENFIEAEVRAGEKQYRE